MLANASGAKRRRVADVYANRDVISDDGINYWEASGRSIIRGFN